MTPAATDHDRPHVAVLGLVAAGKSTVATALAQRLGLPHVDSDEQLAALTGLDGATIADREGVEALHDLEAAVLLGALSLDRPSIVSAAASTVESARCRRRTERGDHRRPIDVEEFARLRERRAPRFAELADVRLDATTPTATQVEQVVRLLDRSERR